MVRKMSAWARAGAGIALALTGIGLSGQTFVPPAGYTGKPGPGVATPPEPGAPALARISEASLSDRFQIDPAYPRRASAAAKVIGAFTVAEPPGTHLVAAWAPGFLPITLSFSDGRCFSFGADYNGGILSNGRLNRIDCAAQRHSYETPVAQPPAGRALRFAGVAWGYGAWVDDRAGTTVVTAPFAKTFEPLFTARMPVIAMMAMNGPDWPGGNMTLVGRIDGRITIVTLEIGY